MTPFGDFTGGVRVAAADPNGGGTDDLILGTASRVSTFSGKGLTPDASPTPMFESDPFGPGLGGVFVG